MSTDFTVIVSGGGEKKTPTNYFLLHSYLCNLSVFCIKLLFLSFVCEIVNIVPYLFAREYR